MRWSIVIPVKQLPLAKTRLHEPGRTDEDHRALVLALAYDTVAAAMKCPSVARVVIVTNDLLVQRTLSTLTSDIILDEPDSGLNPALEHGAAYAVSVEAMDGVAAMSSDLPALRADELGQALRRATAYPRAFVSDAEGHGTTLLAARRGDDLAPQYGSGSRAAHLASGAVELAGIWPSLQRDVDTPENLLEAAKLGLGESTRRLLP